MNISEVLMNGVPLNPDDWSWENHTLTIYASAYNTLHLQHGETCTITYRYSDPKWCQFLDSLHVDTEVDAELPGYPE